MVKGFELINGMFCSTLLLHKSPTMRKLQKAVKEDIRSRLRFSYAPPREEALTLNRAMLFYLDQMDIYQTREYPAISSFF